MWVLRYFQTWQSINLLVQFTGYFQTAAICTSTNVIKRCQIHIYHFSDWNESFSAIHRVSRNMYLNIIMQKCSSYYALKIFISNFQISFTHHFQTWQHIEFILGWTIPLTWSCMNIDHIDALHHQKKFWILELAHHGFSHSNLTQICQCNLNNTQNFSAFNQLWCDFKAVLYCSICISLEESVLK